jgi:tRNA threonylcarbamoyladenosine biosynthesis protein TsaE
VQQVESIAKAILEKHPEQRIFSFVGEMGAGKTTLIKELCLALGVQEHTSSPTFALVNEYQGAESRIFHFDFYRLEDEEEAEDMGLFEYLDSGEYCFIEWPEKIANLLMGEPIVEVKIENHAGERSYKF